MQPNPNKFLTWHNCVFLLKYADAIAKSTTPNDNKMWNFHIICMGIECHVCGLLYFFFFLYEKKMHRLAIGDVHGYGISIEAKNI